MEEASAVNGAVMIVDFFVALSHCFVFTNLAAIREKDKPGWFVFKQMVTT